jgi:hypothetical protein
LAFNSLTQDEQLLAKEEQDKYLERQKLAHQEHGEGRMQALGELTILAFNCDLQVVLNTPRGTCGQTRSKT